MSHTRHRALSPLFLIGLLVAQDPENDPAAPERLAEWPALKAADKDRVRQLAAQFRKAQELHADAHKQLVALGAGAVPILVQQVTDRAENVNAALFAVIDEVIDARHTGLLAREAGRPSVEWRRYLLSRLCDFEDPTLQAVFDKARKDKDEQVVFFAALGQLAGGHKEGLDEVLTAARTSWADVGTRIAAVLPRARSRANADMVLKRIETAAAAEQMAGLRLLRFLLDKTQGSSLRRYLESADHQVKREAINAARVVHGEEPIENLSAFKAIEMAKEWLNRL